MWKYYNIIRLDPLPTVSMNDMQPIAWFSAVPVCNVKKSRGGKIGKGVVDWKLNNCHTIVDCTPTS